MPSQQSQAGGTTSDRHNKSHHHIAIIGSGFSGLGMAIKLKEGGERDFVVYEREGGVGGTWRVNHYPGCACDVQSHLYSFSFEPNPNWSRMFAPQPEIRAYLEKCAEKYGVLPHIQLNTEIRTLKWDEAQSLWHIEDAHGNQSTADVVISGMGGLSTPSYPALKGLESFQGKTFHSQRWDHDYDLRGKRVAVIGTGASAIQFVPRIQPEVAHLDLYQRTAPWIMPKPDREVSKLEQALFNRFPTLQQGFRNLIYMMLESRVLGFAISPRIMKLAQRLAIRHIHRQIKDPALREKVTPDYTIGCKRILISNDYYPALAQDNVDVVTDGIREIRANSIVTADGTERPVDAIIFGTGFHATDPVPPGTVFGRDSVDLIDVWKDGPEAYKGTSVAGFPNLFFLMGPNTGLGHNSMVYMIESQIAYVTDALRLMRQQGLRTVDVRPDAQRAFNTRIQNQLGGTVWNIGGCQSWYIHPVSGKNVTLWPDFTWKFRQQTRHFDAEAYQLESAQVRSAKTGKTKTPRKPATRKHRETTSA